MADSRRDRIVAAIVTRMALINGAGGYELNIVGRVKDSETNWAQDQATLPAISVFDGDAMANPTSTGQYKGTIHSMPILIRGFLTQGTTAANARKLIKDIKKAIRSGTGDKFGATADTPLVMQSREIRDAVIRNKDSFEVEGCEVEFEVQFKTDKFNAE
jgi:hypothetical protein